MNPGSRASSGIKDQRTRVLVMDAVAKNRETMGRFLTSWNFQPVTVLETSDALRLVNEQDIPIAVLADPAGEPSGIELVRVLRQSASAVETILIARDDSAAFATEAFRAGVYDCLQQPVDFRQLSRDLNTLRDAVQRRLERKVWQAAAGHESKLGGIVGFSAPMQAVFASLRRFAREDSPVLITGPIGTGKELAATALHALSPRTAKPLLIYRCCGVSEELAAAELFGAPAGKSTGCAGETVPEGGAAIWQSAQGGTILLDEIADLPLRIQENVDLAARSGAARQPGVRLLAATRFNLADQVAKGQFSANLYELLGRNVLYLPSLGERPEDIPLLCRHFLEKYNQEYGKQVRGFSSAAERALLRYGWPGNVRELENVIGRACLLADQDWIEIGDLSIVAQLQQPDWPAGAALWPESNPPADAEREKKGRPGSVAVERNPGARK